MTAATAIEVPELPHELSPTPTDPACPGRMHGTVSAYRRHGCKCPEVMERQRAYHLMLEARHREEIAAGVRQPRPSRRPRPPVDEGDVEAAFWAAKRRLPVPAGLTTAERVVLVHRLHLLPGTTWWGPMSAAEIGERIDRSTRQVQRYLSIDPAAAWAGEVDEDDDDEGA